MQMKQEIGKKKERPDKVGGRFGWTRAIMKSCHTMTKMEREGKTWMKTEGEKASELVKQARRLHVGETRRGQRIQEKKVVGHLT